MFGIYTQYVGVIAFIHLLVAAAATYKVTKSWIWVIGGIEYCVFWAICCLVVAMRKRSEIMRKQSSKFSARKRKSKNG